MQAGARCRAAAQRPIERLAHKTSGGTPRRFPNPFPAAQ
jgi:hypothetical protein